MLSTIQTFYRKCLQDAEVINSRQKRAILSNSSSNVSESNSSQTTPSNCEKPWSYLQEHVLPDLWRVVYWSSQILSWYVVENMPSPMKKFVVELFLCEAKIALKILMLSIAFTVPMTQFCTCMACRQKKISILNDNLLSA